MGCFPLGPALLRLPEVVAALEGRSQLSAWAPFTRLRDTRCSSAPPRSRGMWQGG